jgi:glycerol-3-phosphate cytidylyltransferase
METKLKDVGVRVVYFPYTKGTSSSILSEILISKRNEAR